MRPGIFVLLKAVAQLWAAEGLYVAPVGRVGSISGSAHLSAGAIIRCLGPLFDAPGLTGQFADPYPRAPARFTAERWFTAVFAVAQHTDVKVVVAGVRFGATDAQIMKKLVEYRRELLGLPSASLSAAKRVFHRL